MNMTRSRKFRGITGAMFLLFAFVLFGHAQTQHPKKPVKKPTPVVSATPLPGEAEIIRTGDQVDTTGYLSPSSIVRQDPQHVEPDPQPVDPNSQTVKDLSARVRKLESTSKDPYEEKQKRLLLNLDIISRAEQRSESLRKQYFDLLDKENTIRARLDQIEYDSRPDVISRSTTFAGSMRPEEIREMRKKSLDAEKSNLQSMLTEIQNTKTNVSANLTRSDALVEKLRAKLETDIDNSFKDDEPDR